MKNNEVNLQREGSIDESSEVIEEVKFIKSRSTVIENLQITKEENKSKNNNLEVSYSSSQF